jgi:DNA-binding NarL/FixJ family response regulator
MTASVMCGPEVGEIAVAPLIRVALTPRENQIAELLVDGLSNKDIAARLGIRKSTLAHQMHTLSGRFGIRGERVDRVRLARLLCGLPDRR